MSLALISGAQLLCSRGTQPGSLVSTANVLISGKPAATTATSTVTTFGLCTSPANPLVANATAGASGVLTPMPCVPVASSWVGASPTVLIGGAPALSASSSCLCRWGGQISATNPGQQATTVP